MDNSLDRFVTGLMSSNKKSPKNDLKTIFEEDLNSKRSLGTWNVD